jgi:hypothetical protein
MRRTNKFFIFDRKTTDHGNKIWMFRCSMNKKILVQIVKWKKKFRTFALIISNPNEQTQDILTKDVLTSTPRTLSQIEFANDLYPKTAKDVFDLRDIICHGLTLKNARGVGYNREDDTKDFEKSIDHQDTLYFGSNGFVRKNKDYTTGKYRSVSKGLTIYLKPTKSCYKKYLRIEIRLNRQAVMRYIRQHSLFNYTIQSDLVDPKTFMLYKYFNRKALKSTGLFRKKKLSAERKVSGKSEKFKAATLGLINTIRIARIEQVIKYTEAISNTHTKAAMPIQIARFREQYPTLKHRITEFFPVDEDRQKILIDIENGFVSRYYPDRLE